MSIAISSSPAIGWKTFVKSYVLDTLWFPALSSKPLDINRNLLIFSFLMDGALILRMRWLWRKDENPVSLKERWGFFLDTDDRERAYLFGATQLRHNFS